MINYELPTLARNRGEGGIYIHSLLLQGHTNRGQLLGSDAGVGSGGGSVVAWDSFYVTGVTDPRANDVQNTLTFQRVRYVRTAELTTGVTLVREFNRDFQADAWNMNLLIGFREAFF
jgi:hypothetical protein